MSFGAAYGAAPYAALPRDGTEANAAGFTSTQFGTARGPLPATGFVGTQFGLARIFPFGAAGWQATVFGTPIGIQRFHAQSLGLVTIISTAYTTFAQSKSATGFAPTVFGTPLGIRQLPSSSGVTCQTFGSLFTIFGDPSAASLQLAVTTGTTSTLFGTPRGVVVGQVSGFTSLTFGTPIVAMRTFGVGFKTPLYGTATARYTLPATGVQHAQRFGLARVYRPTAYAAYGFTRSGRFGQPRALNRFNYSAAGFTSTVMGTPYASEKHRAFHLAPNTTFGTAIVQRSTVC